MERLRLEQMACSEVQTIINDMLQQKKNIFVTGLNCTGKTQMLYAILDKADQRTTIYSAYGKCAMPLRSIFPKRNVVSFELDKDRLINNKADGIFVLDNTDCAELVKMHEKLIQLQFVGTLGFDVINEIADQKELECSCCLICMSEDSEDLPEVSYVVSLSYHNGILEQEVLYHKPSFL